MANALPSNTALLSTNDIVAFHKLWQLNPERKRILASRAITFDLTLCTHPKVDSAVTYWKILHCLTASQGKRLVVMQKVWTVSLSCHLSSKCFHLRCVWGHTRIAHWFCSAWNFAWEIIRRCYATMSLTVQTFHKKTTKSSYDNLSVMLNSRHDSRAAAFLHGLHARPKVRTGCAGYITSLKTWSHDWTKPSSQMSWALHMNVVWNFHALKKTETVCVIIPYVLRPALSERAPTF